MKRVVSILVLALLFMNVLTLNQPALAAEDIGGGEEGATNDQGLTFTAHDRYKVTEIYSDAPNTFEAWLRLPTDLEGRGGVILGSYDKTPCVSFEIHESGAPRLFANNAEGDNILDIKFTDVNLLTGEWEHLAIVRDTTAGKLYCYRGGELAQSVDCPYDGELLTGSAYILGGDYRIDPGNTQYFKGELKEAALFSDARTAEEIAADHSGITPCEELIAHYDTFGLSLPSAIEDKSGNGYGITSNWMTEKEPVTDYAYSFAVVGDTQIVADYHQDEFHKIYDYILENVEEKKIKFVFGLGDITNDYNKSDDEWKVATENIFRMDGVVPYSLVRGNHDDVSAFKRYLPLYRYRDVIGGSYDSTMLNTWQTLTVGEIDYLILALDLGASTKVLNWANKVIAQHPDHNVIITTHAYLTKDGTTLDDSDGGKPTKYGAPNNGDDIWNGLVRNHGNVVLVMSGHIPSDTIVTSTATGRKGNKVTQMLIDPQGVDSALGGVGLVAMLHFSEDGKNVTVDYYSTIYERYYMEENQFTFTLDTVEKGEYVPDPKWLEEEDETKKPSYTSPSTDAPAGESADQTQPAEQGGCGSSLGVSASVAVTAALMNGAILIRKRKNKNRINGGRS